MYCFFSVDADGRQTALGGKLTVLLTTAMGDSSVLQMRHHTQQFTCGSLGKLLMQAQKDRLMLASREVFA